MAKTFMGVRLRSLRAERGMSQVAFAHALGLSPSYLNQIEQDQRPLTVAVLLKIHRTLGVDIQQFSEDEVARLVAQLRDALADNPAQETIDLPDLQELASKLPKVGRAILALHRRQMEAIQRMEALSLELGDGRDAMTSVRSTSFEAVQDFFFVYRNYFHGLDTAAEALAQEAQASGQTLGNWLTQRLLTRHGVRVVPSDGEQTGQQRRFDPHSGVLYLSPTLKAGQQAFQLATQLALLDMDAAIQALVDEAAFDNPAAQMLARIGLANYVAGALLLPYTKFLQAAESLRYDIDQLAQQFGVGFETVCHRLSTLQRPGAPGVPFFFMRLDRSGNISKRQSATHFHFSKTGGTCPLWNVYEAFSQPGRVLPQLASMPDGRAYLWIARSVSHGARGYGSPRKTFSLALGCDIQYAPRLVYSKGLDLKDPNAATPIGMGCKVCERTACPQRAFPFVGQPLRVNENESWFSPYSVEQAPPPAPMAPPPAPTGVHRIRR